MSSETVIGGANGANSAYTYTAPSNIKRSGRMSFGFSRSRRGNFGKAS